MADFDGQSIGQALPVAMVLLYVGFQL